MGVGQEWLGGILVELDSERIASSFPGGIGRVADVRIMGVQDVLDSGL